MDNFMDKIAQKWSAGEVIKANSAAEAMELKRLQEQVAEYETILQEMRKLNLKNAKLTDETRQLVEIGNEKIQTALKEMKESVLLFNDIKETQTGQQEEESLTRIEGYVHTENVKVYRNVQAVVVDSLKNQTDELRKDFDKMVQRMNCFQKISIAALVVLIGNFVVGVVLLLIQIGIL